MRKHPAGVFDSVEATTERDSAMVEYFLWQQFEGMRQLGALFGPLLRAAEPPAWWYYEREGYGGRDIALHLIPRDPVWLRVELPRHIKRGYRIANAILLDPIEADEAVANALIHTEAVPYVPDNFGAYFDRAVRNAAVDIQRRRCRRPPTVSLDDVALHYDLYYDSPSPEDDAVSGEIGSMVQDAIGQLPPIEQKAVELHYLEGLSIRETALSLGKTIADTQNILARARRNLCRILAPQLVCGKAGLKAVSAARELAFA
jgi:RNA polymerase sigma factor (sigma-70 family)